MLGTDVGQGGGPSFAFYVQGTDGFPPVWLGEGDGQALSPDGRRAVAIGSDGLLAVYPLEGGAPTPVRGLSEYDVPLCWTPDGRELMVARYEESPPRIERVDVASGRARPWADPGRSLPSGLWGQTGSW